MFGAINQLKEADYAPFVDCEHVRPLVACLLAYCCVDLLYFHVYLALNEDQRDILMKFIYKGLETGDYPNLFKLHAVLFEKSGYGVIVRALSERKTV